MHSYAANLQNQIARLTHEEASDFNLPEIDDEMFGIEDLADVSSAVGAREQVMRYVKEMAREMEAQRGGC